MRHKLQAHDQVEHGGFRVGGVVGDGVGAHGGGDSHYCRSNGSSMARFHHLLKTFYTGVGGWANQQLPTPR
jgi:hypothetical protein